MVSKKEDVVIGSAMLSPDELRKRLGGLHSGIDRVLSYLELVWFGKNPLINECNSIARIEVLLTPKGEVVFSGAVLMSNDLMREEIRRVLCCPNYPAGMPMVSVGNARKKKVQNVGKQFRRNKKGAVG